MGRTRGELGRVAVSWWPWLVGRRAQAWDSPPPLPRPSSPRARRVWLLETACYLGGLMPSRYNSTTLPYTSRSREHIYPVYAVKLLAPAGLLWSLMSIPLVFREDGLGWRSGSAKVDAKMGDGGETRASGLASTSAAVWPHVLPMTTRRVKVKDWMCQIQFSGL